MLEVFEVNLGFAIIQYKLYKLYTYLYLHLTVFNHGNAVCDNVEHVHNLLQQIYMLLFNC